MGFSVASLRKVLLLVVLMSPVASSMQSNGVALKSKLWRKESTEVQAKCGYSKQTCSDKATSLGLQLGGGGYAFAAITGYSPGCYSYNSGTYSGMAFYGLLPSGGGEIQSQSQLTSLATGQYRLPDTHSCQAATSGYKVGDQVEGLYRDGVWYEATIEKIKKNDYYKLKWADGGTRDKVKPASKIRPAYKVGDQVEGLYKDGVWYKAIIEKFNGDGSYTLNWADGGNQDKTKGWAEIRVPPINIEFGGDTHRTNSRGYLSRPESLKSKACTADGCEDCSSPANCWHGATSGDWGYILLDVLPESKFTHYVVEVWARCPSSSTAAEWHLEHNPTWRQNGLLELYVGSTKVALGNGRTTQLPITGEDKARIRLSWKPNLTDDGGAKEGSSVKVWLEAHNVDSSVDSCMAVKDCLEKFGDDSNEAFKLRNANDEQLSCLTGQWSGMSSGMKSTCEKWDNCVTTSGKKPILLAMLSAAIKQKSLLEGVSFANDTRKIVDAENCVDPQVDDPESWDCECAEEMTATCSGPTHADQDLETCIKTLLCQNPNVCSSWQAGHCEASLMEQRRQESTKVARIEKLHNGLDSALQGKCSQ